MEYVDKIVNIIKQDINSLRTDELGGVIFEDLESILQEAPDIESILNPEPDVFIERTIPESKTILGAYTPMKSPGVITLYSNNIKNFFWRIVQVLTRKLYGFFITKPDLERLAILITRKTYYHEIFHFNCDVFRLLFGCSYDILNEEALAVAYSRNTLKVERSNGNSQIGRMNAVIYNTVMDRAFRYTSPGYRNWRNFPDEFSLKNGLID
ncbi:MAG: hypothetical protein HQK78_20290, partial [Desulfobacterales bacterium]|nr:hypothetical protein [Desulfobacterales bacterium]